MYDFAATQADGIDVGFSSHGAVGDGVTTTPSGANVLIDPGSGNSVSIMATAVNQAQSHII